MFIGFQSDQTAIGRLDGGPRVVALDHKVLIPVGEDIGGLPCECERRVGARRAGELLTHLIQMIEIDVAVTARPDEVSRFKIALRGHHVGEERVTRDIKGHAEEQIAGSLVELAGKLAVRHIELEKTVAGGQCHVRNVAHVPSADDHPPAVRMMPDLVNHFADLIDLVAVCRSPGTPLSAVNRTEIAVLIRPLIPDRHFVVVKILDICVAVQEPEQFMNDRARMQLLRGDERKAFREREPHLVAENRDRSGACAVSLLHSVFINVL